MKIKFEYIFEDGCYGYVDWKDERTAEVELKEFTEIKLSPCKESVKVTTKDFNTAEVDFPYGSKLQVGMEKTPFTYVEHYECFEDVRSYKLSGTVQLTEH